MLHVGLDEREPSTAFIEYAEGLCEKKTAESKHLHTYILQTEQLQPTIGHACFCNSIYVHVQNFVKM